MFTPFETNFLIPVIALILISTIARMIHFMLFEKYFKLTFEHAPIWSLFYFSTWTALVVISFHQKLAILFGDISITGYIILTFFLLGVFPLIYKILRSHVGSPKWLAELFPGQGMLSLEERYIVAKIADVVFQQCVAGALILTLSDYGLSYQSVVIIFVVLFALAHLYIFHTAGFFWGLHYTMYATLGGFAFPFLILFIPGGIGYAIIIHMLFYVLSGAFFAKLPHPENTKVSHDVVGLSPS